MSSTRLNILVVDNDEADQKIIVRTLRGFADCVVAANVSAARSALAENTFDAALVDVDLGPEYGLSLIPDILVPAVVLTQHDDDNTAIAALNAGAAEYMVKSSLSPNIARRVITLAIERERLARALEVQEMAVRLYDRIANPATSLLMNLSVLQEALGRQGSSFEPLFGDMEKAVNSMTRTIREVQAYAAGEGPRPTWDVERTGETVIDPDRSVH